MSLLKMFVLPLYLLGCQVSQNENKVINVSTLCDLHLLIIDMCKVKKSYA